jgi:hypothetical protein
MGRAKGAKFSSFRSSGGRLRNRTQRSWGQGWRTLGESHSVQWGYKAGGRLENRTQCSGGQGWWTLGESHSVQWSTRLMMTKTKLLAEFGGRASQPVG